MPIQQPVDTCWYLFCEQRHQRISLQRCTEATRRREIDSSWPKSGWENKCSASSASSSYTSSSFCIYKLTPKAGHGDFTFSDLFSVFALLGPSLRTTPYKSERCRRWTSSPFTKSIQVHPSPVSLQRAKWFISSGRRPPVASLNAVELKSRSIWAPPRGTQRRESPAPVGLGRSSCWLVWAKEPRQPSWPVRGERRVTRRVTR